MSRQPAVKRRKLTPPPTDGEDSAETTAKPSAFFRQASSWNLEQDYENRPRKGKKDKTESTRLPIKAADGVLQHVVAPAPFSVAAAADGDGDENSDLEWLSAGSEDTEQPEVPQISLRQQILEAREEMARIALLLNEDPEEHAGAFKTLAQLGQTRNMTIQKLALATQLAVYKDVIPGYRIRPLSEEDMETKVSKEVRRIRAYEQALVAGYQGYLKELTKLASSGRSGRSRDGTASLASTAIACACGLLDAVPHFNFRKELLKILVGKLSTQTIDDDFIKCRDAIEKLFKDDEDGTPALDAVVLLSKMMKQRGYRVHETVLNTFLHLRLLSEFHSKASTNHVDRIAQSQVPKQLKQKREFRTKKTRKLMKEQKTIEKEMQAADATVSHEERDKMQAETLKLVFVTYFRILKIRSPVLMGAVLEGLARYAHLINQDFFGDLLEALKELVTSAEDATRLTEAPEAAARSPEDEDRSAAPEPVLDLETQRNLTREALLCCITAFALLEGQDAAKAASTLSLDLSFFITHLYRTLHALALNPDIELSSKSLHLADPNASEDNKSLRQKPKVNARTTMVLLLKTLRSILLPSLGARAIPPLRIAAFCHQLTMSALHLPEKSTLSLVALLSEVVKTHRGKVAGLWNTEERRGDGRFDAAAGEVEESNPFAGTVWAGELLRLHFCPGVRAGLKRMEGEVAGAKK